MEAQLDVLAGKQKTLERYRDGLARVREAVGLAEAGGETTSAVVPAAPRPRPRRAARPAWGG